MNILKTPHKQPLGSEWEGLLQLREKATYRAACRRAWVGLRGQSTSFKEETTFGAGVSSSKPTGGGVSSVLDQER